MLEAYGGVLISILSSVKPERAAVSCRSHLLRVSTLPNHRGVLGRAVKDDLRVSPAPSRKNQQRGCMDPQGLQNPDDS